MTAFSFPLFQVSMDVALESYTNTPPGPESSFTAFPAQVISVLREEIQREAVLPKDTIKKAVNIK